MIEFLVGLLVLVMMAVLALFGVLLFPVLLLMGLFLRFFVGLAVVILVIWLIGKATLVSIEVVRKRE